MANFSALYYGGFMQERILNRASGDTPNDKRINILLGQVSRDFSKLMEDLSLMSEGDILYRGSVEIRIDVDNQSSSQ